MSLAVPTWIAARRVPIARPVAAVEAARLAVVRSVAAIRPIWTN